MIQKERVFHLKLSLVLECSSPLDAMPAHKQVSKQPASANKTGVSKKPAACELFRPYFKVGEIAMKATFDHEVPFSSGMYTAVVMKSVGCGNQTHHVQFVRQLAVEDPAESGAHKQNKKHAFKLCTQTFAQQPCVPSTKFEIVKAVS